MPSNDWSRRPPPTLGHVRPDRPGHASSPRPPQRAHPGFPQPPSGDKRRPAPPPYDDPPLARRSGLGRAIVYGFLGLVALIAVGFGVLVAAPPVDLVRARVVAEVERQTGRKLAIGSAGVSFASGLGVSLGSVSLSAPPAMGGAPLVTAERVEISLALLPLVMREVQVDRLTIVRPVVALHVDASGRRTWDFAAIAPEAPPSAAPVRYAQAGGRGTATDASRLPSEVKDFVRNASPPGGAAGAAYLGLDGLALADVRLVDGRVRYADARTGTTHEVSRLDARLSLPSIAGALTVKGEATVSGERMAFDARLDQLRELLSERPVAARIKLDGKLMAASYDGKLASAGQATGEGRIQLKAPSAAAFAKLLELPLAGLEPLGAISLDGQLRVGAGGLSLTSTSFATGATAGSGTIGLETAGERPRITANLRFTALDLDQLSAVTVAQTPARAAAPSAPPPAAGSVGRFAMPAARKPDAAPPKSIEDLIGDGAGDAPASSPATRVHGFRKRAGNQWDVDAIDAAALRLADVDARLQIAALKANRLDAANVQAGIDLKGGVLRVSITDGQLAGGAVRGLASIDARQASLTVGANLSGDQVALKPILDAAGMDLLDGRGRVIVAVSAQGSSERELVSTLTGRAEVKVADGALVGWDADAIVAGLAQGRLPQAHRQPNARTPFKELSGTFQIAQGVARSKDLKLDSPSLAASGTGTINIVDRNVDLLLKPRVAAGGIEVPIRVAGSWDDPKVVADVNAALKSPQAQEAVKQLKDGNVEGALRSVLGNGPKADEKIGKAKEALRGLLGR